MELVSRRLNESCFSSLFLLFSFFGLWVLSVFPLFSCPFFSFMYIETLFKSCLLLNAGHISGNNWSQLLLYCAVIL